MKKYSELTLKEIVEKYTDVCGEDFVTSCIEELTHDCDERKTSHEEKKFRVSEVTKGDLDEDGNLWCSAGVESWPYITGRTYEVSTLDGVTTLGYVYQKEEMKC